MLTDEEEAKLQVRTNKLATEKAYLQLAIELINRLSGDARVGQHYSGHDELCVGVHWRRRHGYLFLD